MEREITKCCVCDSKSGKEVCKECNRIYENTIGATFESRDEIREFMENEDIPPYRLRKLGREMSAHIYGGEPA